MKSFRVDTRIDKLYKKEQDETIETRVDKKGSRTDIMNDTQEWESKYNMNTRRDRPSLVFAGFIKCLQEQMTTLPKSSSRLVYTRSHIYLARK